MNRLRNPLHPLQASLPTPTLSTVNAQNPSTRAVRMLTDEPPPKAAPMSHAASNASRELSSTTAEARICGLGGGRGGEGAESAGCLKWSQWPGLPQRSISHGG